MVGVVQDPQSTARNSCIINTSKFSAPSEVPVLAYISERDPAVGGGSTMTMMMGRAGAVTLTNHHRRALQACGTAEYQDPKLPVAANPEGWNTSRWWCPAGESHHKNWFLQ
ncbi:hypothetical protein GWK47_025798 [Chionoecetes opilio]|uniref:Uncharacterized protein n=1 Tax=Chionoecetes opilio TaxID=41210 RepID=A0A8J8WNK7_CHIOP|nr:hypothetical protein GWK47_025798 [Chionoecetes opilio]